MEKLELVAAGGISPVRTDPDLVDADNKRLLSYYVFLCCLRSIAALRDHFVWRLSVRPCVCLSGSHTLLVVRHSLVSQATYAFLGMLPLCLIG